VAELPLDDVEWYASARELDGVGVAQLVRREAAPHTGDGGLAVPVQSMTHGSGVGIAATQKPIK
jgi:hypothetical protein